MILLDIILISKIKCTMIQFLHTSVTITHLKRNIRNKNLKEKANFLNLLRKIKRKQLTCKTKHSVRINTKLT